MAKYVESKSVEKLLFFYSHLIGGYQYPKPHNLFMEMSEKFYDLPTIDIVCCKDCKYGEVDAGGMVVCNNPDQSVKNFPDYFCRDGE